MYGTVIPDDMSSPVSYTATIDGLFSDAADCASHVTRPSRPGSGAQRLDRDHPVKPDVAGPVDLRHAAAPDDTI
jgi:hypothetical protein